MEKIINVHTDNIHKTKLEIPFKTGTVYHDYANVLW